MMKITLCVSVMVLCNCLGQFGVEGVEEYPAQNIPSLITRGTHYQIGHQVGCTFQHLIHEYYKEHPLLRPVWLPWSETPTGRNIVKSLLSAAKTHFPQYVTELQGMAKGANISFIEMFLANHYVELAAILANKTDDSLDSCSDLLVNQPTKACVVLGHNEDNTPLIQNKAYILIATVVMETNASDVKEQFTAYCYPGQLPGNAFGFNHHGLIQSVNGLYPKLVMTDRVGRAFITRAMLAADNISSAVNSAEANSAYGLSANLGVLPKKSGDLPKLYNLEVAPNPTGSKSLISLLDVPVDTAAFHVNMYRRIPVDQIHSHIVSSVHRTLRIEQFSEPETLQQMYRILGDTHDTKYPIFRRPRPSDNETTLATAIFDLMKCTLAVYQDNPKTSPGPLTVFHLPCRPVY